MGDLATMAEDVFAAWQTDRAAGLDSIMLAPTRDLVSELNQQARGHRLAQQSEIDPAGSHHRAGIDRVRRLADGNEASIDELIITRENDRGLRTSATDWVKNGGRWTILEIHDGGDLSVQHTQHRRTDAEKVERAKNALELVKAEKELLAARGPAAPDRLKQIRDELEEAELQARLAKARMVISDPTTSVVEIYSVTPTE